MDVYLYNFRSGIYAFRVAYPRSRRIFKIKIWNIPYPVTLHVVYGTDTSILNAHHFGIIKKYGDSEGLSAA